MSRVPKPWPNGKAPSHRELADRIERLEHERFTMRHKIDELEGHIAKLLLFIERPEPQVYIQGNPQQQLTGRQNVWNPGYYTTAQPAQYGTPVNPHVQPFTPYAPNSAGGISVQPTPAQIQAGQNAYGSAMPHYSPPSVSKAFSDEWSKIAAKQVRWNGSTFEELPDEPAYTGADEETEGR